MFHLLFVFFVQILQAQFTPSTGGGPPTTSSENEAFITLSTVPTICANCCFDVIFALDKSEVVDTPEFQLMLDTTQQLAIAPRSLNNPKIRVGVIQVGTADIEKDDAVVRQGSRKTGIGFSLKSGPFNEDKFDAYRASPLGLGAAGEPNYYAGMSLAIDMFKAAGNPWDSVPELEKVCKAEKFRRLIIWIVDGPLSSKTGLNSPCVKQGSDSKSKVEELINMDGYNYVLGIGTAGNPNTNTPGDFDNLQCMFPAVSEFDRLIRVTRQFTDLQSNAANLLNVDPCIGCANIDLVFLLDESSSQCNSDWKDSDGLCPEGRRNEWDQQIRFVKNVIGELAPTWEQHRVEVIRFSSAPSVRYTNIKLQCSGAASESTYPGLTRRASSCNGKPRTVQAVLDELDKIRGEFSGGETATAAAISAGLTSLEWVPDRKDGTKPRKVLLLVTDGGPNAPYYDGNAASQSARYKPPCDHFKGQTSANGWCLDVYHQRFFINSGQKLNNFAVCTDAGDPNPPAIQWHFGNDRSDKYQYFTKKSTGDKIKTNKNSYPSEASSGDVKTYHDVLKELEIVPIVIEVGSAAKNHKKDIDCLLNDITGSGVLDADSFERANTLQPFTEALMGGICRGVRLRESTAAFMNSSNYNIFARWNQFVAFKQAYESEKMQFKQWLAMKQQQQSFVKTSQVSHVELMVGAVLGGSVMYFFAKKARRSTDYSHIPEFEGV